MALNRFHVVSPLALVAFSACKSPFVQQQALLVVQLSMVLLNQALRLS